MKSRQAIRAETPRRQIPRPENYQYGKQLAEWEPAETSLTRDEFIRQVVPMNNRIVVQLVNESRKGRIMLTDRKQLISGDLRKAIVLKTGPGRWIPGEWWWIEDKWEWVDGYRRAVDLLPGQTVFIGNWIDLEIEDIALCQEMDARCVCRS